MSQPSRLSTAVEAFALRLSGLHDADLETPWDWKEYSEGVRFAIFRTYEDLRELGARLAVQRQGSSERRAEAQAVIAQYHAAFRDLQAVLLSLSDEQALIPPAPEEWTVRQTLVHMIQTERNFYVSTLFSLENFRKGDKTPPDITEEVWDSFWQGDRFRNLYEAGPLSTLLDYYVELHQRIIYAFEGISEVEMQAPAYFWEETAPTVRFRLHRFDSHLRQHTVQIEKTLGMLGLAPREAGRLLRLVYAALAEVEGWLIGDPELGSAERDELAAELEQRLDSVAKALESGRQI